MKSKQMTHTPAVPLVVSGDGIRNKLFSSEEKLDA